MLMLCFTIAQIFTKLQVQSARVSQEADANLVNATYFNFWFRLNVKGQNIVAIVYCASLLLENIR